jgi:hypothetical protein
MSNNTRTTLDAWLRDLTGGGVGMDDSGTAVLTGGAASMPIYVLHPGASEDIFILAVEIDRLPADCPREVLANLLALNNRPAMTAGAFGVNPEDGTLTYRYIGEMAGMDFPYFRNTVANFSRLAEQALVAYRKLGTESSVSSRGHMLAAQRVVA